MISRSFETILSKSPWQTEVTAFVNLDFLSSEILYSATSSASIEENVSGVLSVMLKVYDR